MSAYHVPVLLEESVAGLNIQQDGIYVDATYGGGGHSKAIIEKLKEGRLIAFDQDIDAAANKLNDDRLIFINQNFKHLKRMLRVHGITEVDGILADLGISSYQVDTSERGFAHRFEGPLDMRMDKSGSLTAEDILNAYAPSQLQRIFGMYGEVRNARTLAQVIADARVNGRIDSVGRLIEVIAPVIKGNRNRYLSQVFQALRMEVNDELAVLADFLEQSKQVLKTGGRLVVISYHSIEDRLVKNFIRHGNATGEPVKDFFGREEKYFHSLTKKPVEPSAAEIGNNPRAHSARLRIAERTK
ncbi:MAG: 16S rRNA (cytosine(1402)-N(4))-methyltransferase RsmH [Chitinophagaceae bacterium]|nr:16S rRNA (cytosine(1402)-N(4))-methyltransferase RsmH [Chitinophagaceae bacterium]